MALDLLTSGIWGGITGLFGSGLTAWSNIKTQKLKNEHDKAMKELDISAIKAEAEANVKITQTQTEGQVQIAETNAYSESIKSLNKDLFDSSYMKYLMKSPWTKWIGAVISLMFGMVDVLKTLARPGITYYLMGASTYITIICYDILQKTKSPITVDQAYSLFNQAVNTVFYLTVSAVSWWFCDRKMEKHADKFLK